MRMSISCDRSTVKIVDEKRFFLHKKSTDSIVGKQYQILSSATKAILIIDAETGTINQNGNRMHIWLKRKTKTLAGINRCNFGIAYKIMYML